MCARLPCRSRIPPLYGNACFGDVPVALVLLLADDTVHDDELLERLRVLELGSGLEDDLIKEAVPVRPGAGLPANMRGQHLSVREPQDRKGSRSRDSDDLTWSEFNLTLDDETGASCSVRRDSSWWMSKRLTGLEGATSISSRKTRIDCLLLSYTIRTSLFEVPG